MPPLETREDAWIRDFYRQLGCIVVSYSQPRATKQTPGIPDLQVFHPRSGTWWYHEVKRRQGPGWRVVNTGQSDDQKKFQAMVEAFGIEYLCGAREVAIEKMQSLGVLIG